MRGSCALSWQSVHPDPKVRRRPCLGIEQSGHARTHQINLRFPTGRVFNIEGGMALMERCSEKDVADLGFVKDVLL
jgi:hypothetical protein